MGPSIFPTKMRYNSRRRRRDLLADQDESPMSASPPTKRSKWSMMGGDTTGSAAVMADVIGCMDAHDEHDSTAPRQDFLGNPFSSEAYCNTSAFAPKGASSSDHGKVHEPPVSINAILRASPREASVAPHPPTVSFELELSADDLVNSDASDSMARHPAGDAKGKLFVGPPSGHLDRHKHLRLFNSKAETTSTKQARRGISKHTARSMSSLVRN